MKNKLRLFAVLIFGIASFLQSCEKGNETKISSFSSKESHNMGQNCMTCHSSGGEGEGWFNAAGTVYDSLQTSTYANAIIKLYSGPNGSGTVKATIEVDGNGNFYTTDNIDFGSGLYPSVKGNNITKYMGSTITMGQCNSCHGQSTNKIWTK